MSDYDTTARERSVLTNVIFSELTPKEVASLDNRQAWRLHFEGRVERLYRHYTDVRVRRRIWLVALIVGPIFMLWGILSLRWPELGVLTGQPLMSFALLLGIGVVALGVLFLCRRNNQVRIVQALLVCIVVPTTLTISALRFRAGDPLSAELALLLNQIFTPLLLGLRFRAGLILSLAQAFAAIGLPFMIVGPQALALIDDVLIVLLLCGVLLYHLETDLRRDFAHRALIQQLAMYDALTGALNRRAFMTRAEGELVREQRYQRGLVMLVIDLDHFKRINDTYGHAAGDEALRCFAQICRQTIRSSDMLGRLGGEEFALLLVESDIGAGQRVAERLRARVAARTVIAPHARFSLTISVGVVSARPKESLETLLTRADEALYAAKERGRDQVVLGEVPAHILRSDL